MESCAYTTNCTNKKFITEAMNLSEKLLKMAEKGILTCEDDSCLTLYGVIRDCGYKIRRTVEQEGGFSLQKKNLQKLLH
jgi:hypothetical protein